MENLYQDMPSAFEDNLMWVLVINKQSKSGCLIVFGVPNQSLSEKKRPFSQILLVALCT